jgi:hypothetical protein
MAIHLTRPPSFEHDNRRRQLLDDACKLLGRRGPEQRKRLESELSEIVANLQAHEKACKDSPSQADARENLREIIGLLRQLEKKTASPLLPPALVYGSATFVFGGPNCDNFETGQLTKGLTDIGRAPPPRSDRSSKSGKRHGTQRAAPARRSRPWRTDNRDGVPQMPAMISVRDAASSRTRVLTASS